MPQETKSHPAPAGATIATGEATDVPVSATGAVSATLQGWIPPLASEDEIRSALEKAFDYRGDITLTLKNGQVVDGYLFDRNAPPGPLHNCRVRIIPRDSEEKKSIAYDDIAALAFSGRDTAAGKSFETWIKKYWEKKRAGETNIQIEPEKLD